MQRSMPQVFCKGQFDPETLECLVDEEPDIGRRVRPSFVHLVRVFLVCLALWTVVVGGIWIWRGSGDTLTQLGLFFTKASFVTFGGAPFIEAMAGNQRLQAALTGVSAAVVGVVLNLAVWFSQKVVLPNDTPDLFAVVSAIISED